MKNFLHTVQKHTPRNRGFTLIEIMVASGMFITAMLLIVGALVSLETASRKARATRVAMDNVGGAIDSMSRALRTGADFHCDTAVLTTPIDLPQDCTIDTTGSSGSGGTILSFEHQGGNTTQTSDQYIYRKNGDRIERSTNGGVSYVGLTAPEIRITTLRFWVGGVTPSQDQPYVTMLIRGTASTSARTATSFNIQTTVSQRTPNFF